MAIEHKLTLAGVVPTYDLAGSHHKAATYAGKAAERAMQAEVIDQTCADSAAEQTQNAGDIDTTRTEDSHQAGGNDAAKEHAKEMPVLGPGDEDVAQTNQIELHDERVEAPSIVELLALSQRIVSIAIGHQYGALILCDAAVLGDTIDTSVAAKFLVGIDVWSRKNDAGHEPSSGNLAQKDDQHRSQLPDAKFAQNPCDNIIRLTLCWSISDLRILAAVYTI